MALNAACAARNRSSISISSLAAGVSLKTGAAACGAGAAIALCDTAAPATAAAAVTAPVRTRRRLRDSDVGCTDLVALAMGLLLSAGVEPRAVSLTARGLLVSGTHVTQPAGHRRNRPCCRRNAC